MPRSYQRRPWTAKRTEGGWRMIARCIACRGKAAGDGREHVFRFSIWLPVVLRASEYSQAVRPAQSRFTGSRGHFALRNRFARANPVRSNQGGGGLGNGASHGCERPGNGASSGRVRLARIFFQGLRPHAGGTPASGGRAIPKTSLLDAALKREWVPLARQGHFTLADSRPDINAHRPFLRTALPGNAGVPPASIGGGLAAPFAGGTPAFPGRAVPKRGALRSHPPATRHLLREADRARSEDAPFP